ncbi:TVP38/TMEM64 family protein [Clostridium vincentii]|uniref:SNARE associated Golgi protein n=1 Tax=Clostridium vincentii TaxID=52704 RepID=A0A2T0B8Q7_9CLOT|nr:VTT domain-containing protein [Clostridium vincentii]PRR80288.1 SNARE associated Golgi protein [Clostridium vincentii]
MELIYIITCFLQPILLPTPEAITISMGSMAFGSFNAFVMGFLGTMLGIITMYSISKRFGLKLIMKFIKDKDLEKYKSYVKRNEVLLTGLLFIIPILPDEVVCAGAGVLGIAKKPFFIIAAVTKMITIASYSYMVEFAANFNIHGIELILTELVILIAIVSINGIAKYKKVSV